MSKLTEYLTLIPQGLKNADKIVEGVVNQVKMECNMLDLNEQEEVIRRRLICESCPFNSINAKTSQEYLEAFGKNYYSEREELHCSVCSCVIKTKTASMDSECGIHSKKQTKHIPLKWTNYNKPK